MSDFDQFLEKIKSLQIQTSKSSSTEICAKCGKPKSAHLKGLAVCVKIPRRKPTTKANEEQSFSA